jgi:hypothetical protein
MTSRLGKWYLIISSMLIPFKLIFSKLAMQYTVVASLNLQENPSLLVFLTSSSSVDKLSCSEPEMMLPKAYKFNGQKINSTPKL